MAKPQEKIISQLALRTGEERPLATRNCWQHLDMFCGRKTSSKSEKESPKEKGTSNGETVNEGRPFCSCCCPFSGTGHAHFSLALMVLFA